LVEEHAPGFQKNGLPNSLFPRIVLAADRRRGKDWFKILYFFFRDAIHSELARTCILLNHLCFLKKIEMV